MISTVGLTKVIDLTYYLLLTPFRLKKTGASKVPSFTVKKSVIQMILCGTLTFLDFLVMAHSIRRCVPFDNANNPQRYFNLFGIVASQVGKCFMIRKLWLDSESFLIVANHTAGKCMAFILKIN